MINNKQQCSNQISQGKILINAEQYQNLLKKLEMLQSQNKRLKNIIQAKEQKIDVDTKELLKHLQNKEKQNASLQTNQNNIVNTNQINFLQSKIDNEKALESLHQRKKDIMEDTIILNQQKPQFFQECQQEDNQQQEQKYRQRRDSIEEQSRQIYKKNEENNIYSKHRQKCTNDLKNQTIQQRNQQDEEDKKQQISKFQKKQPQIKQGKEKYTQKLKIVEQICLFGPCLSLIETNDNQNNHIKSSLIYPKTNNQQQKQQTSHQKTRFRNYSDCFFPDSVQIKKIRQEKQPTEAGRIIHKKNLKRQQICSYIFQAEQNHSIHKQILNKNQVIQVVNPNPNLYAFSIHFTDYICIKKDQIKAETELNHNNQLKSEEGQNNIHNHKKRYFRSQSLIGQISNTIESKKSKDQSCKQIQQIRETDEDTWDLYLSKFCLSIFTYFPLVNLFEKTLIKIVEQIKIKRMEAYANQPQDLKSIDINYFIKQLDFICNNCIKQINQISIKIDSVCTSKCETKSLTVNLSLYQMMIQMYHNWSYQILKIFDKQTLYQTILCMLFQQSVCFISQDTHILTYCLLLFCDLLIRPFFSPHPCSSVLIQQQLLGTPFIINLGIPKSSQWYEDNKQLFLHNKVVIDLNGGQAKFKTKRKPKGFKSQKLRKIINTFYKKMRGNQSQLTLFSLKDKKSSTYNSISTKQQNQNFFSLLTSIQNYFEEELLAHLPGQNQIKEFIQKQRVIEQKQNLIKKKTVNYIQEWVKNSRKKEYKDQLISSLLDQQTFYIFASQKYNLQ